MLKLKRILLTTTIVATSLFATSAFALKLTPEKARENALNSHNVYIKDNMSLYKLCQFSVDVVGKHSEDVKILKNDKGEATSLYYQVNAQQLEDNYWKRARYYTRYISTPSLRYLRDRLVGLSLLTRKGESTSVYYYYINGAKPITISGKVDLPRIGENSKTKLFAYGIGVDNSNGIILYTNKDHGDKITKLNNFNLIAADRAKDKSKGISCNIYIRE